MVSIQLKMASFPHPPLFVSLRPRKPQIQSPTITISTTFVSFRISSSSSPNSESQKLTDDADDVPLPLKLAFEKASQYKKDNKTEEKGISISKIESKDVVKEVPLAVKLAMEKANQYKQTKGDDADADAIEGGKRKIPAADNQFKSSKKDQLSVSSIDFVGLNFADKKIGRGLPAGLVPPSDPFPSRKLPEVEILVGDTTKFGDATITDEEEEKEDDGYLYKPKVSTWGVFPRPNDISKTYGGGRNIRPGEELESAEEKAIKEAKTKQLLAAYKAKIGLKIDPKLKSECEKALKDGNSFMDIGKLKEALPFYELVMEKLAFQHELHGLAALQWSICQDSLGRAEKARMMYDKLQFHPIAQVSKKAKQFNFGFQAMEMMKVSRASRSTGYQNYFNAFVKDKTNFAVKEDEEGEDGLIGTLPYLVFLASPIVILLLIVVSKFQ